MELTDFKLRMLDGGEITTLDMYLHKGLEWVEHSSSDTDTLFEEFAGCWEHFTNEEKVEILLELADKYRNDHPSPEL